MLTQTPLLGECAFGRRGSCDELALPLRNRLFGCVAAVVPEVAVRQDAEVVFVYRSPVFEIPGGTGARSRTVRGLVLRGSADTLI
jgi:hypothetical protein